MRRQNPLRSMPASIAILRLAALLVPRRVREVWLAEWKAELWHVWRECRWQPQSEIDRQAEVTGFCLGAFKDALWVRQEDLRTPSPGVFHPGSASRCSLVLAAAAAAGLLLALYLPDVRSVMRPLPSSDANVVTISKSGHFAAPQPSVEAADYLSWSRTTRRLFTGLAFYQPSPKQVRIANGLPAELTVAMASNNLFELLNLPIQSAPVLPSPLQALPRLILSSAAWQTHFGSNPQVFGTIITISGQRAVVAGLFADATGKLPRSVDLWLLEDRRYLEAMPSQSEGFVIGRILPAAFPHPSAGRHVLSVFRGSNGYEIFDCISMAEQARQPNSVFLFALFLACLALPATTSLPLGEYPETSGALPWGTRVRRWAFLATKLFWIIAIVYWASLDLAYGNPKLGAATAEYLQLASSFPALLFAFRWALRDQRKRCPVCLRSLTNPAQVGQCSRNFLAWNGTELVCLGGHGLLHVPDIPTSWFSTQRWLYLDASWSGLFSAGPLVSPGTF